MSSILAKSGDSRSCHRGQMGSLVGDLDNTSHVELKERRLVWRNL